MTHTLAWIVVALTILLILVRPKKIPEAAWAVSGALLLIFFRVITPHDAMAAIARGTDVYLFLTGMMVLAELARLEGFFDWVSVVAVKMAKGSPERLFTIIYVVGTIVTIFLSNDATSVVLTPAVLAALKKTRAKPLPYLFICAFIANAASFVLPISNPANLVLYGSSMPPLTAWFRSFALPSFISIAVTFGVLRLIFAKDLEGIVETEVDRVILSSAGKRASYGIAGTGAALMIASALNINPGLPTFLAAIAAAALVTWKDRDAPAAIIKDISWEILPLVAGLFVLVAAVNQAGALGLTQNAIQSAAKAGPLVGSFSSAFGVAFLANIANNLPVGLIAGSAIQAGAVPTVIRNALLIGVDLGPNLSVTGSLATILWLIALRRDGENVSFWTFLRVGIFVMPVALALSILAALLTSR